MAELFAFDKETMYFWWNIKKCRSIVGSGRSFCIRGVFWYSIRLGSVLGMWNATRFGPRFVPKLSIRFMSTPRPFHSCPVSLSASSLCFKVPCGTICLFLFQISKRFENIEIKNGPCNASGCMYVCMSWTHVFSATTRPRDMKLHTWPNKHP